MSHHADGTENNLLNLIAARVREDNSPALQICSNTSSLPIASNITASRFAITPLIRAWNNLFTQEDAEAWSQLIENACLNHNAFGGVFGLRRFDNAVRTFVLRGEPQFDENGGLCCHVISGMDITEVLSERLQPTTEDSFDLRGTAKNLHERLVSTATILVSSADIIEGVASSVDADHLLKIASGKLSTAAQDLVEHLRTLSLTGRSNRNGHSNF